MNAFYKLLVLTVFSGLIVGLDAGKQFTIQNNNPDSNYWLEVISNDTGRVLVIKANKSEETDDFWNGPFNLVLQYRSLVGKATDKAFFLIDKNVDKIYVGLHANAPVIMKQDKEAA